MHFADWLWLCPQALILGSGPRKHPLSETYHTHGRGKGTAEGCEGSQASAQYIHHCAHMPLTKGIHTVQCDVIGPWSMLLLQVDAGRRGLVWRGPVEWAVNALNKSYNLSVNLWWSLCKKLEDMLILPKIIFALLITHLYSSVFVAFCLFNNFSFKCQILCKFWRHFRHWVNSSM